MIRAPIFPERQVRMYKRVCSYLSFVFEVIMFIEQCLSLLNVLANFCVRGQVDLASVMDPVKGLKESQ